MDVTNIIDILRRGGDTKPLVVSPPKREISLRQLDAECHRMLDNCGLEITITFRPVFRCYTDIQIRKMCYNYLRNTVRADFQYILYPEYGDNHNLHYHGVIYTDSKRTKTYISELKRLINRDVGRSYIRCVQYVESYKEYIQKERDSFDIMKYLKLIIFRL